MFYWKQETNSQETDIVQQESEDKVKKKQRRPDIALYVPKRRQQKEQSEGKKISPGPGSKYSSSERRYGGKNKQNLIKLTQSINKDLR